MKTILNSIASKLGSSFLKVQAKELNETKDKVGYYVNKDTQEIVFVFHVDENKILAHSEDKVFDDELVAYEFDKKFFVDNFKYKGYSYQDNKNYSIALE